MKRILVLADEHCGHRAGLTPPHWHSTAEDETGVTKREKLLALQRESWNWYVRTVSKYGPYDLVVNNGDAIDGRGERSGGTELVTCDRMEQCEIARICIRKAITKGTKLLMTYGTPYHTGQIEDWENKIATDLNAMKIGSHEWIQYGGVVLDFKHKVGGGSTPHTRGNAASKDALWNRLWAEAGLQPKSDVIVRSHVHHSLMIRDSDLGIRLTTPALQTMGSKYGARQCSGTVSYGFVVIEIDSKGTVNVFPIEVKLASAKASAIKL